MFVFLNFAFCLWPWLWSVFGAGSLYLNPAALLRQRFSFNMQTQHLIAGQLTQVQIQVPVLFVCATRDLET